MRFTPQTYRITIESYTTNRDSAGTPVKAWATYCEPYASIRYDRSTEGLENNRDAGTTGAIFKVRYDSDTKGINHSMRITHDGDTWDIESVMNLGRDEGIELRAKRKDS